MLLINKGYIVLLLLKLYLILLNGLIGISSQGVTSDEIVLDPAGKKVGPRITLSSTVLTTGDELEYTCIEGGDAEDNRLSKLLRDGSIEEFEESDNSPGSYKTRLCDHTVDPQFTCTIINGKIPWKKEYGGRYCCSAFTNEWYYVYWIDPALKVSQDRELDINAYGSEQRFYCSVDMTPDSTSYGGIFKVEWEFFGQQTRSEWRPLAISDTVISQISSRGANYTLTIKNFNPIQHGGEYRCQASVKGYLASLSSEKFAIKSLPKATLRNNKRNRDFTFGIEETGVVISCEALSYPFPSKVEFKLQSVVLDGNTPGVSSYGSDLISTNVKVHKASFVVDNVTAVFQNDSVFECRVFRSDGKEAISQTRIILREDTPPLETTTSLFMPQPTTQKTKNEKTKPWVIAIAVIIPIVIILVIVVLLVWKCRHEGGSERGGNSHYYAPSNDLSRTYNTNSRYSLHSQPSYAVCKRDPAYASPKYSSEYAQSKIHQNPIYGSRPAGASCYGQAKASGLYDTPRLAGSLPGQYRPGTISQEYRASGEPPKAPPPGVPVLPPLPASTTLPHQNGSAYSPLLAKPDVDESHSEPEN